MPDEFEQIRDAMSRAAKRNGRAHLFDEEILLLDNQRAICATLALIIRGGRVPIETAREMQERAKAITKILEGT